MMKILFFFCHFLFVAISIITVYWVPEVLILQCIIIVSWLVNNNKCLITQLEDYLFGETLLELYYQKQTRFIVPTHHRCILYISFFLGLLYHFSL